MRSCSTQPGDEVIPVRAALIFCTLALPLAPQEPTQFQLSPSEWTSLRALVQSLTTEEGSRALFRQTYRLSQSFTSEFHFLEYVAPWRSGLRALPERQEKAGDVVDLRVIEKREGLSIYVTFFRGTRPPGDLVFLRTTWVNGELTQLNLLKGSSAAREGS